MKSAFFPLLLASFLIGSLGAQEDVPPKHFRFIPLGELPAWEEDLVDGIRVGKDFPDGSIPPKPVAVLSGEASFIPLRLNLTRYSQMLTLKGNTQQLLFKKGTTAAAPGWLAGKMPAGSLNLGVLYRDPKTMNWNQPKVLLLDDSEAKFPTGHVRFTNVSDVMVIVQIGDWDEARRPGKKAPPVFGVPSGRTLVKQLKPGANKMRIGYAGPNKSKIWVWENKVSLLESQRLQTFFYKAQGAKPRQPFLFHFAPETIPQPPRRERKP